MTPRLLRCARCGHETLVTDDRCGGIHDMREVAAPAPALDADTLVVSISEAVKGVCLAHGIRPAEFLDAIRRAYQEVTQ